MTRTKIAQKKASQQIKREYVMNPAKGLNSLVSESLIDKREASALLNIAFDESGIIVKRNGFQSVGNQLTKPQGLGYIYSESNKELFAIDNGQPKRFTGTIWSNISGVTLDANRPFIDFTQAGSNTYIWDAVSGGVKYDGTTTSRPGKIPKGKFSIYNNGLHICSGVPGQPSRVYVAAGGKPDTFTRDATGKPAGTAVGDGWPDNATDVPGATDFSTTSSAFTIDISKNDGYAVTGLAVFQGSIVIFKENAIYQLTFDASLAATVAPITKSVGCVSHRTIQYVENDVYFLSRRGVFVLGNEQNYYTAIRTNELTARVRPTINQIQPSSYERCSATYSADQYLLAVPVASTPVNRVLSYDRRYQAWSLWDTIAPIAWLNYIDNSNVEHLYFIQDQATTYTLKEIVKGMYSDDGAAINAYWESGALDAGAIDITKRWVDLGLVLRRLNGVMTVSIYTDGDLLLKTNTISSQATTGYGADMIGLDWIGGADPSVVDTGLLLENEPYRFVIKKNSRTVKFRVENGRLNESFAVLGYILGYYPYSYYKYKSANKIY